jgi:DNA-binding protein HU-beta
VNKSELIQQLANRTELSRSQAQDAVDALFSAEDGIISQALKDGEKVQITGFGSFETRKREARKGRNPRTGKEIDIAASTSAAFRPGKGLKDSIGGGGPSSEREPRRPRRGSFLLWLSHAPPPQAFSATSAIGSLRLGPARTYARPPRPHGR